MLFLEKLRGLSYILFTSKDLYSQDFNGYISKF